MNNVLLSQWVVAMSLWDDIEEQERIEARTDRLCAFINPEAYDVYLKRKESAESLPEIEETAAQHPGPRPKAAYPQAVLDKIKNSPNRPVHILDAPNIPSGDLLDELTPAGN